MLTLIRRSWCPVRFKSRIFREPAATNNTRGLASQRARAMASRSEYKLTDQTALGLLVGDITTWKGDAIVNAGECVSSIQPLGQKDTRQETNLRFLLCRLPANVNGYSDSKRENARWRGSRWRSVHLNRVSTLMLALAVAALNVQCC